MNCRNGGSKRLSHARKQLTANRSIRRSLDHANDLQMSVDGVRSVIYSKFARFWLTCSSNSLRQAWNEALNAAQAQLQSLLTSATSPQWRRVPPVASEGSQGSSEEAQVIIHKRPSKQGEIFRLVHDIPTEDFSLAFWKAVLVTPEMRQEWDPAVESAQLLEIFDVDVRIAKTYFTLGWPAKYVRLEISRH